MRWFIVGKDGCIYGEFDSHKEALYQMRNMKIDDVLKLELKIVERG